MRYVREAGSDPSFLLKALNEAYGELRGMFYGVSSQRMLLRRGQGVDEDWNLLAIAVHLRDTARGVQEQLEAITTDYEPEISNVDFDDIPILDEIRDEDEDQILDDFHYHRRHSTYLLWDLLPSEWEKCGIHPYRGRLSILEIARDTYQHDLEHLWQARRMVEALR